MKLGRNYEEVVKKGIEADPREKKDIELLIKEKKQEYEKLESKQKDFFDLDTLFNPFADTRILNGNKDDEINSMIVGIDVEGEELLLVDRLKEKDKKIDLVVSHHPLGRAYANFYEVMDLQIDMFTQKGLNVSFAESLLRERKAQVERRVGAANHQRGVDIAKWLGINLMCIHTPADNLAYRYIKELTDKEKPKNLGQIIDLLMEVQEYKEASRNNNPPKILMGDKKAKVSKIYIEFTGGTEGPDGIYDKLSNSGIDTIIAMHQSEEHFKKCKEAHINVVVASHIASDSLGINLMLDHLLSKGKFDIYEFSGFKRFSHKK
ncbi:MAG: NGG1p interacting factor NIF3, partial [Candidatus Omnitrophica bacterium]|nr:NGG1p interacting factor NIF3 [Candidatus Omnitrophota bacterium]